MKTGKDQFVVKKYELKYRNNKTLLKRNRERQEGREYRGREKREGECEEERGERGRY